MKIIKASTELTVNEPVICSNFINDPLSNFLHILQNVLYQANFVIFAYIKVNQKLFLISFEYLIVISNIIPLVTNIISSFEIPLQIFSKLLTKFLRTTKNRKNKKCWKH